MSDGPLILVFDTTAARCAAALVQSKTTLHQKTEDMKRGQAERLVPMLEEILSETDRTWKDLNALAVRTGPGNFTGIRLSVATARGLAMSLNIPAIGVSSFEAASHGISENVLAFAENGWGNTPCQLLRDGHPVSDPTENPDDLSLPDDCVYAAPQEIDFPRRCGLPWVETDAATDLWRTAQVAIQRLKGQHTLPVPLYVRRADAAPSADQPPVILDDA